MHFKFLLTILVSLVFTTGFTQKVKYKVYKHSIERMPLIPFSEKYNTWSWYLKEYPQNGRRDTLFYNTLRGPSLEQQAIYSSPVHNMINPLREISQFSTADIKIIFEIDQLQIENKKVNTITAMNPSMQPVQGYVYDVGISFPFKVKVITKDNKVIYERFWSRSKLFYGQFPKDAGFNIKEPNYPEVSQLEISFEKNRALFIKSISQRLYNEFVAQTSDSLNELYGHELKSDFDFYAFQVKSKKFVYPNLDSAIHYFDLAFDSLKVNAKLENHKLWYTPYIQSQLKKAGKFWEMEISNAVKEPERVNTEVTANLNYGLVKLNVLTHDFDRAETHLTNLENLNSKEFSKEQMQALHQYIYVERLRYMRNKDIYNWQ